MDRELKISIAVFLTFLIYGLTSFFQSGIFAVPVFLNQLVLLFLAILFYALNIRLKASIVLLIFVFIQLYACLVDGFTVSFLAQKFSSNLLIELSENLYLNIGFIVVYFSFWYTMIFMTGAIHKKIGLLLLQMIFLTATVLLFFFPEWSLLRDAVFLIFGLLFIYGINQSTEDKYKVFSVLTYQILLLILLESMEYFL